MAQTIESGEQIGERADWQGLIDERVGNPPWVRDRRFKPNLLACVGVKRRGHDGR